MLAAWGLLLRRGRVIGTRRAWVPFALLLAALALPSIAGESVALRVLAVDKGDVAAVSVRPVTLVFGVQDGRAPEKGEVLLCKQASEVRSFGDHSDSFVVLHCGDRLLILRGVFLQ
jgi:hypothetical protein